VEISGSATVNTISGVHDGQAITLWPSGAFVLGSSGNVSATTTTATVGRPIRLLCRNGTLTEILTFTLVHNHQNAAGGGQIAAAALSDGTTGTGVFVRSTDPTFAGALLLNEALGIYLETGAGDPEGVLSRNPGSLYASSDGNLYRKASGSGASGWVTT